jgi:anti-sigma B factor antagonist
MEGSTDEGLSRGAAGDRVADGADHHFVRTDLEAQGGARVEPTPAPFDIRRVDHPLGVVLTVGGELDLATVPMLQEQLDRAMPGRAAVVIDLSGLRFIDSCGLQMLVRAEQQVSGSGGQLVLVRGPRAVHRLFELTGLDSRFELCDSPSAALRTALERRTGSTRRIPKPRANRQAAAELDRELGGVTWS